MSEAQERNAMGMRVLTKLARADALQSPRRAVKSAAETLAVAVLLGREHIVRRRVIARRDTLLDCLVAILHGPRSAQVFVPQIDDIRLRLVSRRE